MFDTLHKFTSGHVTQSWALCYLFIWIRVCYLANNIYITIKRSQTNTNKKPERIDRHYNWKLKSNSVYSNLWKLIFQSFYENYYCMLNGT